MIVLNKVKWSTENICSVLVAFLNTWTVVKRASRRTKEKVPRTKQTSSSDVNADSLNHGHSFARLHMETL